MDSYYGDSTAGSEIDQFRQMEKDIKQYCKALTGLVDVSKTQRLWWLRNKHLSGFKWSDIIDPHNLSDKVVHVVKNIVPENDNLHINKSAKHVILSTLPEGFHIIVNALSDDAQLKWATKALVEYSAVEHTNLTNLNNLNKTVDTTGTNLSMDSSNGPDTASSWEHVTSVTGGFKSFLKLRWSCLGYHYDWTARMYRKNLKSKFPDDLSSLCKQIASAVGTDLEPEAAIVNYYPLSTTMGGHLDDAEHTMEKPIVSISLGCSAIFLLGGRDKATKPTAIILRSGDAIVMSGESRYSYHGVPFIIPSNFQPVVEEDGQLCAPCDCSSFRSDSSVDCDVSHAELEKVSAFLREARLNINVRQVRVVPDESSDWVDRAGTGAINKVV